MSRPEVRVGGIHHAGGNHTVGTFRHTPRTPSMQVLSLDPQPKPALAQGSPDAPPRTVRVSLYSAKRLAKPYWICSGDLVVQCANEADVCTWMTEQHFSKRRKPQQVVGIWEREREALPRCPAPRVAKHHMH